MKTNAQQKNADLFLKQCTFVMKNMQNIKISALHWVGK
jgi:hypothetical protein